MILIYPQNDVHGKRLEKVVALSNLSETVVFHELENLFEYLKQPPSRHRILVCLASSRDQLQEMRRNIGLLDDLKIILVLSGDCTSMNQAACKLYPRYITNMFGDFSDVRDVLIKLKSRFPEYE